VSAGLRAANARLRELLAERDTRIGQMEAQIADLQAQVADLAARVKQNSENSSKPPSSDGLGKPGPKSLRKKTGRKPGRPKGQPGATMELTDHPDRGEPAGVGPPGWIAGHGSAASRDPARPSGNLHSIAEPISCLVKTNSVCLC
jgi:hypothetical protein